MDIQGRGVDAQIFRQSIHICITIEVSTVVYPLSIAFSCIKVYRRPKAQSCDVNRHLCFPTATMDRLSTPVGGTSPTHPTRYVHHCTPLPHQVYQHRGASAILTPPTIPQSQLLCSESILSSPTAVAARPTSKYVVRGWLGQPLRAERAFFSSIFLSPATGAFLQFEIEI